MSVLTTSSPPLSYQHTAEQITIYLGFFVFITGLIGNTLNVIIFTSLKTFRETSCAFYLTIASVANIIHLFAGLFSRILITGYNIDLTQTSMNWCKMRQYIAVIAPLMAVSSMVFAAIDQFCSLTIQFRRFSQRQVAWRLTLVTLIFWCSCNIPVILYHNVIQYPAVIIPCSITNIAFATYYGKFYVPYLLGFIQIFLRIGFGLLAFFNVRRLAYQRVPIIRLERDKQITAMVLIEVLIDVFLSSPFFIYYIYRTYHVIDNLASISEYQLVVVCTAMLNYATFAIGFYIFCCASVRFRKQLVYVLLGIHVKYWGQRNRVGPQITQDRPVPSTIDVIIIENVNATVKE